MSYCHCDTPRSCQVEQCIPGVLYHNTENSNLTNANHSIYGRHECTCPHNNNSDGNASGSMANRHCTVTQCNHHQYIHHCPMHCGLSSMNISPCTNQMHNEVIPSMPLMPQGSSQTWKGCNCKNGGGVSINNLNSPGRFLPDGMSLPAQPVCPIKEGSMGICGALPSAPTMDHGGQHPGHCRPRCMKF